MAEPQEIGLNPIARPTDQYAPAEVRRKIPGSGLIQLGDALRGVSKDVDDIADRHYAKWQQASQMQGQQYADQHVAAIKNQQDLKDAVARGDIHMADNPWFMVGAKQTVARNEAIGQMTEAKNDLFKDPVSRQDDPNKVDAFLRQRMQNMTQGRDAWETSAMHAEADAARQRILSDWTDQRRGDRIQEAHASSTTLIRQRIDQWNPELAQALKDNDPEGQKRVDGMVAATQAELQNLGSTVDWPTANSWVSESVLQAARDHRDPDIAQRILDGLKGKDGAPLSRTADNRAALTRLPREIEQLRNMDLETEVRNHQLQATKEAQEMMLQADKWKKDQGVATLFEVKIPKDELAKHSPLAVEEFNRMQASAASEWNAIKNTEYGKSLDELMKVPFAKAAAGTLSQDDVMSFGAAASLLGDQGTNAMERLSRFVAHNKSMKEGVTDTETLSGMVKAYQSGTLNTDMVLQARQDGKLNSKDAEQWLVNASHVMGGGFKNNPYIQETMEDVKNLVSVPARQDGMIPGEHSLTLDKIVAAQTAFVRGYEKLAHSDGWDKLTYTEQHKQIEELRDSVVKSTDSHAPTMDEWLKQYKQGEKTTPLNKQTNPVAPPTEQKFGEKAKSLQESAGDPLALQGQTVQTLSKMLNADVTKMPLHEMVQWTAAQPDPLGPGIHSGQQQVANLNEIRAKTATFNDPTLVSKVNIAEGRIGTSRTAYMQMETETKEWQKGMQQLQTLKPLAIKAQARLQELTSEFQKTGTTTFEQQQEAKQLSLQYLSFLDLRKHLGYTPEEVKDMGPGAWRQAPMFANLVDLKVRGEQVASKLGVKPEQMAAFAKAQMDLMQENRKPGDDK